MIEVLLRFLSGFSTVPLLFRTETPYSSLLVAHKIQDYEKTLLHRLNIISEISQGKVAGVYKFIAFLLLHINSESYSSHEINSVS